LTDSGGITEETTVMNVPCMTLRNSTERPETCDIGTNILVGNDTKKIANTFKILYSGNWKQGQVPKLWDGKTASRIVNHLIEIYKL
jgi:UDP-N-acetylglucosamine 2-epimerase (non-hydrolysing)